MSSAILTPVRSALAITIILSLLTKTAYGQPQSSSTARPTSAAPTGGTSGPTGGTSGATGGTSPSPTSAGPTGSTASSTGGSTVTGTSGSTITGSTVTGSTVTGTATTPVTGSTTTVSGGIDEKCGHAAAPLPPMYHPVEIGCTERSPCLTPNLGPHSFCCRHALRNGDGTTTIQTACLSAGPQTEVEINSLARLNNGQFGNRRDIGQGNFIYYRG